MALCAIQGPDLVSVLSPHSNHRHRPTLAIVKFEYSLLSWSPAHPLRMFQVKTPCNTATPLSYYWRSSLNLCPHRPPASGLPTLKPVSHPHFSQMCQPGQFSSASASAFIIRYRQFLMFVVVQRNKYSSRLQMTCLPCVAIIQR